MAERLLPPLRLLTVFETVTRTGSIQKASASLNVSQPAVSQSLKALEDHVGMRLLDRASRPAGLTDAGRILQAGVTEGLERISEAVREIHALRTAGENAVTLACSVGTATYWLMPRLTGFYTDHPDIAVNVMTTLGSPDFNESLDLVIRYGAGDWHDGEIIKLFDEKVTPVCSPAFAGRLGASGSLAEAILLHVKSDEKAWLTWREYFRLTGQPENRRPGRYFSSYVQATQAALSGQGVMLGWESNTGDLVRDGKLVALAVSPLHPRESFYLVAPKGWRSKAAVNTFVDWLLSAASDARLPTS